MPRRQFAYGDPEIVITKSAGAGFRWAALV